MCFGPTGSSAGDQMHNHVDCSLAEGFPGNHNVLESPIELADDELSFFSAKLTGSGETHITFSCVSAGIRTIQEAYTEITGFTFKIRARSFDSTALGGTLPIRFTFVIGGEGGTLATVRTIGHSGDRHNPLRPRSASDMFCGPEGWETTTYNLTPLPGSSTDPEDWASIGVFVEMRMDDRNKNVTAQITAMEICVVGE